MNNKSTITTRKIVITALMAALTVAGSAIRVTLPADMGAACTIVGAQNALDTVSADGTVSFELPRSAFSAGELPVVLLTVSAQ